MAESWFGSTTHHVSVVHEWTHAVDTYRTICDAGWPGAWLKSPWGTSGRGNRHLPNLEAFLGAEAWAKKILASQGALVLEPALDPVLDLSVPLQIDAKEASHVILQALISRNGSSCGHILGKHMNRWPISLRRAWHEPQHGLQQGVRWTIEQTVQWLQHHQIDGPSGIDMMVHRHPQTGRFLLRPLLEVNVRFTMGHVADQLRQRMSHGSCGYWMHVSQRSLQQARDTGWRPHPVAVGDKRIIEGDVFTTDPCTRHRLVTLLCVDRTWSDLEQRLPEAWWPARIGED
jgi:hypothetical protein